MKLIGKLVERAEQCHCLLIPFGEGFFFFIQKGDKDNVILFP